MTWDQYICQSLREQVISANGPSIVASNLFMNWKARTDLLSPLVDILIKSSPSDITVATRSLTTNHNFVSPQFEFLHVNES